MEKDFELVKSETMKLTRQFAEEFRTMTPSPTERELKPKRVEELMARFQAGRTIPFQWARAFIDGDENNFVRMNGQHSSMALCELDGHFPVDSFVHLDTYKVRDRSGLALLFRQFDPRASARSIDDISGAYQMLEEGLRGVDRKVARRIVEGIDWYNRKVLDIDSPAGDDVFALFHDESLHPYIIWAATMHTSKTKEFGLIGVSAALYGTWRANEDEAKHFWREAAMGDTLKVEEGQPASVMDDWLRSLYDGKELPIKETPVKPDHYYNGCAFAWNAFRAGKTIQKIRFSEKSITEMAD